jgi:hypothetical protein
MGLPFCLPRAEVKWLVSCNTVITIRVFFMLMLAYNEGYFRVLQGLLFCIVIKIPIHEIIRKK